jgi:chromatin segregation and condensation protein Rec8/ScpA/Scc1 (kleisin family)
VGTCQGTRNRNRSARARRPRSRSCLRKGCRRKYKPRCRIQRYCQEPECLRQVRRWQAARRQAKRRQDKNVRAQHAEAEKERRQQTEVVAQAVKDTEVTPARGHVDELFFRFRSAIGQAAMNPP